MLDLVLSMMMLNLNQTEVTEFILLGLTDDPELQIPLFITFLAIYTITVVGNLGMILLILMDSRLHTPMYIFLGNLSLVDFCYSSTVTPKVIAGFLTGDKIMSYNACASQMFFFANFANVENYLLVSMAYDRYAAVCKPLHYATTMTKRVCASLVIGCYICGLLNASIYTMDALSLSFCESNVIHHFFCDVKPLLELACGNTELNLWLLNTVTGTIASVPFFLTFLSYFYIITYLFLKTRSCSMLHKALSTCASHFMVVVLFYAPVLFTYIRPTSGSSLDQDRIIAIMYSVVTPALNPLIYTLRNKEVRSALNRKVRRWL